MMTVMPSKHSSFATCLLQKPPGNGITDPHRKTNLCQINLLICFFFKISYHWCPSATTAASPRSSRSSGSPANPETNKRKKLGSILLISFGRNLQTKHNHGQFTSFTQQNSDILLFRKG
jgi:hypothetical protein